jgi:hypothetical protein
MILLGSSAGFFSALLNGYSLKLVQGDFGKDSHNLASSQNFAPMIPSSNERNIALAILLWAFATYFFNYSTERISLHRLMSTQRKRSETKVNLTENDEKIFLVENLFFLAFLRYAGLAIRMMLFAIILIKSHEILFITSAIVSSIIILIIVKKRYQQGESLGKKLQRLISPEDDSSDSINTSERLNIFIERKNLDSKIGFVSSTVMIFLVLLPFLLSDVFGYGLIDRISLFDFSTFLIFFGTASALAINSSEIGFRFSKYCNYFESDENA